jgi:hypothetical protein
METIDIARNARACPLPRQRDYASWTIEELRELAQQLRVRAAPAMTREELLELFAPRPATRVHH